MSDIAYFTLATVFSLAVSYVFYREHRRGQCGNQDIINQAYEATLASHAIDKAQVLMDQTTLGSRLNSKKPFEVYRILSLPPTEWYLYTHMEDSDPVLMAISEARARAAINGSGTAK